MAEQYFVFPRLPLVDARSAANRLSVMSPTEIQTNLADVTHPSVRYSPTGTRVPEDLLINIQREVQKRCEVWGYPINQPSDSTKAIFDVKIAELLYEKLPLHASEASNLEMWAFFGCVLMPNIVRWRFYETSGTTTERFIGSDRGVRRNTFGRLWWRSHLLRLDNQNEKPYFLLEKLIEDELVQITERPSISHNPRFAKMLALTHLGNLDYLERNGVSVNRRELLRDAVKRIRRLMSFSMMQLLDNKTLYGLLKQTFEESTRIIVAQSQEARVS